MWIKPNDEHVENIDNYLEAIERAKKQLADLHESINEAFKQEEELKNSNSALLKFRNEELDARRASVEAFHKATNESHAKYTDMLLDLEVRSIKLAEDEKDILNKCQLHAATVEQTKVNFLVREKEVNELMNSLLEREKAIQEDEGKAISNRALLNNDRKIFDKQCEFLSIEREELDHKTENMQKILDEIKLQREEVDNSKRTVSTILIEAKKIAEDATIKEVKVTDDLVKLNVQREELKDTIIECKRIKMESDKATDNAKRYIVESNQKIAELNALKTALAQ